MLTTADDAFAARLRLLAQFGISREPGVGRGDKGAWYYEVREAGYKANMMDIQAAIGIHQLRKLDGFIAKRREIASRYSAAFADLSELVLPVDLPRRTHAYHLYTVRVAGDKRRLTRDNLIKGLDKAGIGTSVHFIPLHRQPMYQIKYGDLCGPFRVADTLYEEIVSLPLFPAMSEQDVLQVITAVREIVLDSRH